MGNFISLNITTNYFSIDNKEYIRREIIKDYNNILTEIRNKENEIIKSKPELGSDIEAYNGYFIVSRNEFENSVNDTFNCNVFSDDTLKCETQKYYKQLDDMYNSFLSYIQRLETIIDNENNKQPQEISIFKRIKNIDILDIIFGSHRYHHID